MFRDRTTIGDLIPTQRTPTDKTILFVDDDDLLRDTIPLLLEACGDGYVVDTAQHGSEALEILSSNKKYSLIITDNNMPGMSGCELSRRIHNQYPGNRIMLMSGLVEDSYESNPEAHGFVYVLKKPVTYQVLNDTLKEIFRDHS